MKVTSKVATGAALLIGLLLIALTRNMALVRDLVDAQRRLTEVRLAAVTSTLEILRTLELSEERLQKLFVTRDDGYAAQLERLGQELDEKLGDYQKLALPEDELASVQALAARWTSFQQAVTDNRKLLTRARAAGREEVREKLVGEIEAIRADAFSLLGQLRAGIQADVQRSQAEADEGERMSRIFASLALGWGVFFVLLTMWSLNRPLSKLIAATRNVAAGRFAKVTPKGHDELAELARAFDAMVERLDEVDKTKRDFVSRVSHELKTPLAAMQETNQLMFEELAGPLTDKKRRLLELNLDAGRRLSKMLSRLLDVSRLEAGAVCYDVRPVDLRELLNAAHLEFEAALGEKQLQVAVSVPERPVVIHADRDWMMQVFENLLENAIKFSPTGRRLWMDLRLADGAAAGGVPRAKELLAAMPAAVVTVSDEGPGLPEDATDRVFDRFFQVERHRRAGAGVGLGLAICRDIVSAHGGVLWAANREGGGAVFAFALPLAAAPELQPEAPLLQTAAGT